MTMYGTNVTRTEWTDAQITTLKDRWAKGWSGTQIMGELPFSRSAIMGKISRLKLPPRDQGHGSQRKLKQYAAVPAQAAPAPRTEATPARPFLAPPPAPRLRNGHDPSQRRNPSQNILAKIALAEAEPGLPENLKGDAPDGTGVKFIDLAPGACKWPKGDPLEDSFEFCGCKALPDLPYCAPHARKATAPPQSRNRMQRAIASV
jgi:GcrA cell cycle regulator